MLATREPFSLILFGASGNLARLKLYPALFILAMKKRLPSKYAIVGFARSDLDDGTFRTLVRDAVTAVIPEVNASMLEDFLGHCHYHRGRYDRREDFARLSSRLDTIERPAGSCVRVAYLSVPPSTFTAVLGNLCAGEVYRPEKPFRCIVEKPVGHDARSAEAIRAQLLQCFRDDEVFLLDHYLGKEAVRNIYALRFANPVLERLLKNTLIHHVEIAASEDHGIDGRAGYFNETGTLQDMVQSHFLEMCALLTMRLHEGAALRDARRDALEQLYIPPAAHLNEVILQGQYGAGAVHGKSVPGYREEEGVPADSRTNTFIAMKLKSRTSRWEGVPFLIRTGKRLERKETRISIQFQTPHTVGTGATPNRLDIILQGEAGMRLHLQTKIGGTEPAFRPLILEDPLVCTGDCLPEHGLLLLEAIHGTHDWFLSFAENAAAWRIVDPLQAHLDHTETPLYSYPAGSIGPAETAPWLARDGFQWL